MTLDQKSNRVGFTLVELAIVLAIAGLLFTGLWRLLATGNQQLKDSSAASQQTQLIAAVKNFLASGDGQNFLATGKAVGVPFSLPLPSSGTPAGNITCSQAGDANLQPPVMTALQAATWCSTLPSGFSAGSQNSYGQTYAIQVRIETGVAGGAANTYSFMVVTQGSAVVPDASGGRISSQIGGDGGFIYSTPTCGTAPGGNLNACGSYGAWVADPVAAVGGYGFSAAQATGGHVATRTYVSPDQASGAPWLARIAMQGDTNHGFNTMQTNLYMGTNPDNLYLNLTGSYQGNSNGIAANSIFGSQGTDPKDPTNTLLQYGGRLDAINQIFVGMNIADTPGGGGAGNPALTVSDNSGCNATSFNSVTGVLTGPTGTCAAALKISGNQITTGMVEANVLWASSFIYGQTSDLRMKKNVEPLGNSLADVMKLKPVTFKYKQDSREDIGFIAQDLQKVYPQIVVGRPDGVLGVNYTGLLAPLVSSIQELKHENDELRSEIKVMQAEINAQKTQPKETPPD